MTSTAGPGISLMGEFAGLAYYAEAPAVIFDVQRVGPSTGLPTRTAQGDLLQVAFLSHGDTKHIMLLPCSVEECYTMAHGGVRPRRAVPDAGLRDDGSRSRHEQLDVGRLRVPRQADQPRQAADAGGAEDSSASGAATRTSTATASRTARFRATACRRTSRADRAQREGPVQRAAGRLRREHGSAGAQVRDGAEVRAEAGGRDRGRARRSASSATARRTGRSPRAAISCARRPTSRRRTSGCAPIPSTRSSSKFIDAHERVYVDRAEPRRAAAAADQAGC